MRFDARQGASIAARGLPSYCLKELSPFPLPSEPVIGADSSFTPYLFLSQRAPQDTDIIPIALAGEIPPCPIDEPNLHEGEQSRISHVHP